ncbi:hypothetical protein [Streptomyces sp. PvR018]|uniref:hypothetical protein n=1 Tax=Streptomyces sp. PvR018 TaxID=3156442 RepID=UPI0033994C9C
MSGYHHMDSALYAMAQATPRVADHHHVLVKHPTRFGWSCRLEGCGFFKPAEEFDGLRLVGGGSRAA